MTLTTRNWFAGVGTLLAAMWPALHAQQRDAAALSTTPASASIGGIVTADDNAKTPLRHAAVAIADLAEPRIARVVVTGDDGAFRADGVEAGNYLVSASRATYVTGYYGASAIGSTQGSPIAVTAGERRLDVAIRLVKGAVITGVLLDAVGQPVINASVRAQRVLTTGGARSIAPPGGSALSATGATDDRGVYRLFGLTPGEYVVSTIPRPVLGAAGDIRQITDAEVQWAERSLRASAGGATPAASPAPAPGPTVAYATVFYPDATDLSSAQLVTVTAGQERSGVDLRLRLVVTARVSGRVVDASGQSASGVPVSLLPAATSRDAGVLTTLQSVGLIQPGNVGRTMPDGAFALTGIEPGHYVLLARGATSARGGTAPAPTSWAMQEVDVSGQDVAALSLTLAPGRRVSGRVVFETHTLAAPQDPARVSMQLSAAGGGLGSSVIASLPMSSDGAFTIDGVVPGVYRVSATFPSWTLKSATLGGKDAAGAPFEVRASDSPSDLVVTFTDRPAQVHGTLLDAAGHPASAISVVLFSSDRDAWFQNSWRLRAPVRPATDGTFAFTGLAPGEYCLAALTEFGPNEWFTPAFLDQVLPSAVRVTVAEGENRQQDLRLRR